MDTMWRDMGKEAKHETISTGIILVLHFFIILCNLDYAIVYYAVIALGFMISLFLDILDKDGPVVFPISWTFLFIRLLHITMFHMLMLKVEGFTYENFAKSNLEEWGRNPYSITGLLAWIMMHYQDLFADITRWRFWYFVLLAVIKAVCWATYANIKLTLHI